MDKILATVVYIRGALQSTSSEDILASSAGLVGLLGDLKELAWWCTRDCGSVLGKFTVWRSEVKKIIKAYTEVKRNYNYHPPHV